MFVQQSLADLNDLPMQYLELDIKCKENENCIYQT